jgi:predicted N-acetyltransferase YhbS
MSTGVATDLQLRPASRADLPLLHDLIESAYRGDSARAGWTHEADLIEQPRTSVAELQALLDAPDELLLIASQGATIVGCVQVSRRAEAVAYLGLLTVTPALQAAGLGKTIIAAAEQQAASRFGARTLELSVVSLRPELIAYYERRGFAATGERRPFPVPLDPPLELIVLRKPISPAA